jgi:hypothetical protein
MQAGKHRIEQMLGKCLSSGRKLPEICSFVCSECAAQDLFAWGQPVAFKQTDKHKLGQLELPRTWQKTCQKIWQKIWQGAAKQLGEPGLQNSGLNRQILPAAAWAARAV